MKLLILMSLWILSMFCIVLALYLGITNLGMCLLYAFGAVLNFATFIWRKELW